MSSDGKLKLPPETVKSSPSGSEGNPAENRAEVEVLIYGDGATTKTPKPASGNWPNPVTTWLHFGTAGKNAVWGVPQDACESASLSRQILAEIEGGHRRSEGQGLGPDSIETRRYNSSAVD